MENTRNMQDAMAGIVLRCFAPKIYRHTIRVKEARERVESIKYEIAVDALNRAIEEMKIAGRKLSRSQRG